MRALLIDLDGVLSLELGWLMPPASSRWCWAWSGTNPINVGYAQDAGLGGVLVRTGKFRETGPMAMYSRRRC